MDIRPYEKNAKKHPPEQVEKIANSIREFGMNQPLVVDKEGVIIVGHGRYAALLRLGWDIKPEWVVMKDDLTEEQVKAYRLADNKLNESGWDMDLVLEDLKTLSDDMVELTGFDRALFVVNSEKDDHIPESPAEPQSEFGDLYELGNGHRVLCGDATKQECWERLMDGRRADVFLTDPPYNVDYVGKTEEALTIENDNMSEDAYSLLLTGTFNHAMAWLKPGGVFYIWHADSKGFLVRACAQEAMMQIRQCLIWVKNTMVLGRQDYQWKHEPCLYGWKEGASHLWNADRKQTTVLTFDKPSRSGEHPTMKPVELIAYQLTNNTKGEDIVLDPFLGSGTTVIAAEKMGRYCYGMELDPKYTDTIINRYVSYTGNNNIIKNGNPITWNTK